MKKKKIALLFVLSMFFVSSVSADVNSCEISADCPMGTTCQNFTCEAVIPECTTQWDCNPGEYCEEGTCHPARTCTMNCDCPMGSYCDKIGTLSLCLIK